MANGSAGKTTTGNLRRARLSDVCGWVKRSWDNISQEVIIQSFKTCKISNSLNELKNEFEVESDDEDFKIGFDEKIDMHDPRAR
jgi:hypothetical protein